MNDDYLQKLQEIVSKFPTEKDCEDWEKKEGIIPNHIDTYRWFRQLVYPIVDRLKYELIYSEEQRNLCGNQCDMYRKILLKTCEERDILKHEVESKEKKDIGFAEWCGEFGWKYHNDFKYWTNSLGSFNYKASTSELYSKYKHSLK